VANSPLVKTALHGGDPNWGRLIAVAGRAGVAFDQMRAAVRIGPIVLFANATVFDDRESAAANYLAGKEVEVTVDLGTGGHGTGTVWTCDFSPDYVHINADYRT
jgi:glutamate N-acetyltransferase/amino-acid N-acetyltransferase